MNRRWRRFLAVCLAALLVVTQLQPARAGFGIGGFEIPTSPGDLINIGKKQGEQAVYQQLAKLINAKAAVNLDQEKQSFKQVDEMRDFHPVRLNLTSLADLLKPLPPGDYALDLLSFCTEWSVHVAGHNTPYKLGRADGSRIGMLSDFLVKGQAAGLTPDQLHNVAWDIQVGTPLSQWRDEDRKSLHQVTPELENQLKGDIVDQFKGEYEQFNANSPVKLGDFESTFARLPLGKNLLSLKQANAVLTNRSIAASETSDKLYEATAQSDGKPQILPEYAGNKRSPWSEIIPGVYGRYTLQNARAGAGSDGVNLLELRVTSNAAKSYDKADVKVAQGPLIPFEIRLAIILFDAVTATTEEELLAALARGAVRPLIVYSQGLATQALVNIAKIYGNSGNQKPPRDLCNTALKILNQYERLAQKFGVNIGNKRIAELNRLRDTGQITINDIPSSLRGKFPTGTFGNMTLQQIKQMCGM